jgi:hypothetical protein
MLGLALYNHDTEYVAKLPAKKRIMLSYFLKCVQVIVYFGVEITRSVYRRAGRPRFDFRQEQEAFLFFTASKTAFGLTHPPIKCVPGALSQGVERPEHEADRSPPSSVEVKNSGVIPALHRTSSWRNA